MGIFYSVTHQFIGITGERVGNFGNFDISDELLLHIFAFVEVTTLLKVIPQVCRKWRELCGDSNQIAFNVADYMYPHPASAGDRCAECVEKEIICTVTRFKFIYALDFSDVPTFPSDKFVQYLATCLSHLTVAIFVGCDQLTTASAVVVARECPRLRVVDFSECTQLTDQAVIALTRSCRLHSAFFRACHGLTDQAAFAISENLNSILMYLDCGHWIGLSDAGVQGIAARCTRLKGVCFDGCDDITNAAVVSIASNCHDLTYMSFAWCEQITTPVVVELLASFNLHRRFDFEGCNLSSCAINVLESL